MTFRNPSHFSKRWLQFDPQQPTRPRLLRRFVIAVIGLLVGCALLVWLTA